ncbi:rab-GTPase-TBC domain-containing protein [Cunninghamella echinulata]|nr:rab-GTPase-TBC domain-containing protein [Cunninghamella echinulata]
MEQDDEQSNLIDFQEILQSEVYVDLERLRILARQGIPHQIRGEVWKYLLGVQQADRSKELSNTKERSKEYEQMDKSDRDIAKRIRGEVSRYQRRVRQLEGKHYAQAFEDIILAYLNANRDIEYSPALVSLCAPFIYTFEKECDAYYCFERLMQSIDEEVGSSEWSTSWLQNLLAKEMQLEDLLHLWDFYFSINEPLDFHPFVCLSILRIAKDSLEELEQSEIRTVLLRLPSFNMRMIIADAVSIRHETLERQLSEDAGL